MQLHYDIPLTDIPAVQNVIHLPEDVEHFRSQHAVRIRDDAEPHKNAKTRSPLNFCFSGSQGKKITTRNSAFCPVGA